MTGFTFPPPPGLLNFEIDLKPISLQGSPELKRAVRDAVAALVNPAQYLLSGEVEVAVTWLLHESERYFGVHSPDIDNILKPLLDGLSGPQALIVNDCQVQSVRCHWVDWPWKKHQLQFDVRYSPDDWIGKDGLFWVELTDKLCMPLNSGVPLLMQARLLDQWESMFLVRKQLFAINGDDRAGKYVMPLQMPFHRARLQGYEVIQLAALRRRLAREMVSKNGRPVSE
jgi:hypothetical protein